MSKLYALIVLVVCLTGCGGAGVTGRCPDSDPDPLSPCATSHSQTRGGG